MDIIRRIIDLIERTPENEGYLTTMELCKHLKLDAKTVRKYLHILDDEGRLETKKIYVVALGGVRMPVQAYRIKQLNSMQNSENEH